MIDNLFVLQGFKVGDAVAGFIRGGAVEKDNGAFQGTFHQVYRLKEGVFTIYASQNMSRHSPNS